MFWETDFSHYSIFSLNHVSLRNHHVYKNHFLIFEEKEDDFPTLGGKSGQTFVSINMNYLDRIPSRKISVNTNENTVCIDFIKNIIAIDGVEESFNIARDES